MVEPIWNQPEFFCWTVEFWVEEEAEIVMRGWDGGPRSHFFWRRQLILFQLVRLRGSVGGRLPLTQESVLLGS